MAGESSASPPEEIYVEGITQTLPSEVGPVGAVAGAAVMAVTEVRRARRVLWHSMMTMMMVVKQ